MSDAAPPTGDPTSVAKAKGMAEAVKEVAPTRAKKRAMETDHALILSEVQLVLAEKRTNFALLRTAIAVTFAPVTIWTVLISTSRYWNFLQVKSLFVVVMLVTSAIFVLGLYLILHALVHLTHTDRALAKLRKSDTLLEDLLYRELWG